MSEGTTTILKDPINVINAKSAQKEDFLSKIANRLENITSDANNQTDINKLKKQLKSIVLKIYKYIEQSKLPNRTTISTQSDESFKEFKDKDKDKKSIDSDIRTSFHKNNLSICSATKLHIINSNITIINHKTEFYQYGKYEGEFKNGKKDGKGTMTYKNEYEYQGDWKNGKRDGKGVYISKTSKDRYEGDFKSDKAEGKGIAIYNNGDKYEGDYKDWNKDGKGYQLFSH